LSIFAKLAIGVRGGCLRSAPSWQISL